MNSYVPGTDIRIVIDDVNIINVHAERFRHDLRNYGLRSLTYFRSPGYDINFPPVIHFYDRTAAVGLVYPGAASHVDKRRHPDASALSPPLFALPVEPLYDLIHTLFHPAGGDLEILRCHLSRFVRISVTQLIRVNACLLVKLVEGRFKGKGCLGVSLAPH